MYKSNIFVVSQTSFDDMHEKLPQEYKDRVDVINFRSNVVLSGGVPFQEETLTTLKIGENTFKKVELCKVCKSTLVDRTSGIMMPEPLATFSKYRSTENGVFFGSLMNWVRPQDSQGPFVIDKIQPVSFY